MEYPRQLTLLNQADEPEAGLDQIQTTFVREVTAVYRGARRTAIQMTQPKYAADFIRRVLPDNSREHFIALHLDGSSRVVAYSVIASGTATTCTAHPREIFQRAILAGAVSLIIAHNHPSGSLEASPEDRSVTRRIKEAGKLLGIRVLDHLILGESEFYSFLDSGEF